MEGMDEKIMDELKDKTIERSDEIEITSPINNTIDKEDETLEPPTEPLKEVKKSKKVRSEKQKAAFEKTIRSGEKSTEKKRKRTR